MRRRLRAAAAVAIVLAGAGAVGGATAARFSGTTSEDFEVTANPDWTAPSASAVAIAKSAGGEAGWIRQGGGYHVYANLSDGGNPPAGVGTATADASSLTSGATAQALSASGGPFTIDGATYTHRTPSPLTADGALAAQAWGFSVIAADQASPVNTMASPFTGSVTVDNTAPAPRDIQATNGGAIAKRPDQNDVVTFAWDDTIDSHSVLAGWSGAGTDVVVRLIDNSAATGGNDALQVYDAGNSVQLPLTNAAGLNLGRNTYVGANRTFGASGTPSRMTRTGDSIAITLGTESGPGTTAKGTSTIVWTPSASATDRAGNPSATAAFNEPGSGDAEF